MEVKESELLLEKFALASQSIIDEIHKVIVGQDEVIEQLLIALFSGGHCLITGVPGLAKTMIVNSLAEILSLKFQRIQFTPDLMPSDITGTDVIEENVSTGERNFRFIKGPIFANVILADEINRTPPKTQSALLQAMQEYKVTAGGNTYPLELPFFVLATQNPIEQEGTYPLPEAQLDRFFFNIKIDYPSYQEEKEIVEKTTIAQEISLKKVLSAGEILKIQKFVKQVPISEYVLKYVLNLVLATRPSSAKSSPSIKNWVAWGAGPRASQYLVIGGKARALLQGRSCVSIEDIKTLSFPVLRHRIILNFRAEAEGVNTEEIIQKLLESIPEE